MDTILFNEAIKTFYATYYGMEYNKNVKVDFTQDGDLYMFTCRMWLNQPDRPIVLAGQYSTMEDFLAYVISELKNKKLPVGMDYFKLIQTGSSATKKDKYK